MYKLVALLAACLGHTHAQAACCGPSASCSHDIVRTCVAAFDPYCGSSEWDAQCVSEAKQGCGLVCTTATACSNAVASSFQDALRHEDYDRLVAFFDEKTYVDAWVTETNLTNNAVSMVRLHTAVELVQKLLELPEVHVLLPLECPQSGGFHVSGGRSSGKGIFTRMLVYVVATSPIQTLTRQAAGASSVTSSPTCSAEESYIGLGYNMITGSPAPLPAAGQTWSDAGWSQDYAIQMPRSCTGSYLASRPDASFTGTLLSAALATSEQYSSTQSASFSASAGVPDEGSGTASAGYSDSASGFDDNSQTFQYNVAALTMTQQTIQEGDDGILLADALVAAVQGLPEAYATTAAANSAYSKFFGQFGTHFVQSVVMGGYWSEMYYFGSEAYDQASSDSSSFSLGLSAESDGMKASGSASDSSSQTENNGFGGYVSDQSLLTLGGYTGVPYTDWQTSIQNSISLYPVEVLSNGYVPYYSLQSWLSASAFTTNFCKTGDSSCAQATKSRLAALETATMNACSYFPSCVANPPSSTASPTPSPASVSAVAAPSGKRTMALFVDVAWQAAVETCAVTSMNIQHGDTYDDNNCYYDTSNSFGPQGTTLQCNFAMKSDNHGIYGTAVYSCTPIKGDPFSFDLTWALAEDLADPLEVTCNPVDRCVVTGIENCDGNCNGQVSIQ